MSEPFIDPEVEPIKQFILALQNRGIVPPSELIADGKIHRCDVLGKKDKGDASYVLFPEKCFAGGFQNWCDGKGWENWSADNLGASNKESAISSEKIAIITREREAEKTKRYDEVKKRANLLLQASSWPPVSHPYLTRKQISLPEGVRVGYWEQRQKENCLLIPMQDKEGEVWNLQAIYSEKDVLQGRDKDFLYGGRKKGLYFPIGVPTNIICICEGLATGASIYEATGHAVAVAFDAGNLMQVAKILRGKYPELQIVLCADNDQFNEINTGVLMANEAGLAIDASVVIPIFETQAPDRTDFNDLAQFSGLETVRIQINAGIPERYIQQGRTIHVPTLQDKAIPERKWIVEGWISTKGVTGFYGDGGVGKSLLAMQLLTCAAAGISFLGIKTEKIKVLGFFCEDTEEELHRRQADINMYYGLEFANLENMQWQSRVGCDNVLMTFIREGVGTASEAFEFLRKEVKRIGARLVVIDTAADTFGGNENVRPQVRQFINLLSKLALEIDGSIVLCAHPSASGLARNDGTGGSTAWNNTLRSRIYLSRPITSTGEEMSDSDVKNLRELTKMKANYSSIGDKFILRWNCGVFHVEEGEAQDFVAKLERNNRDRQDEEQFLLMLDQVTKQGRTISDSKNAANFGPKAMYKMDKGKVIGYRRLADAMSRLFEMGVIDRGFVGMGPDRKKKEGVRRCITESLELQDA